MAFFSAFMDLALGHPEQSYLPYNVPKVKVNSCGGETVVNGNIVSRSVCVHVGRETLEENSVLKKMY